MIASIRPYVPRGKTLRTFVGKPSSPYPRRHMEVLKSSAKKTVELLECSQQENNAIDQIYADMGEYNDGD